MPIDQYPRSLSYNKNVVKYWICPHCNVIGSTWSNRGQFHESGTLLNLYQLTRFFTHRIWLAGRHVYKKRGMQNSHDLDHASLVGLVVLVPMQPWRFTICASYHGNSIASIALCSHAQTQSIIPKMLMVDASYIAQWVLPMWGCLLIRNILFY